MRRKLLILFLIAQVILAQAGAPINCTVCNGPLGSVFGWVTNPETGNREAICLNCLKAGSICYGCGRVTVHGTKLDDGRTLCDQCARTAVLTQQAANDIYYSVKRELHGILANEGKFKDDVPLELKDGQQLEEIYQVKLPGHGYGGLQGLTETKDGKDKQKHYHIYIMSGLSESRFAAVCAHECTHVWLHENVSDDRHLNSDTVEGFCELVAYKLVQGRHDEAGMKLIKENAYSRNQITALLDADDSYDFYRLVKWIKNGSDSKVNESSLERVLTLNQNLPKAAHATGTKSATKAPAAPVLPVASETLVLKGVMGTADNPLALINDNTFGVNETGEVHLANTNLTVRCLEIKGDSVVVQILGSTEKQQLFLNH